MIHCNNRQKPSIARETVQSTKITMDKGLPEAAAQFQIREKPGWMAIALIAAFVLAAVGMFMIGARLVKRTPGPDLSAVAVLPFAGDSLATQFSAGLREVFAKNDGLRVVDASNAVVLIEGSVQQSGDRVRVAVRLVRSAGRNALWARSYDFDVKDAAAVQGAIAHEVWAVVQMYQRMPAP